MFPELHAAAARKTEVTGRLHGAGSVRCAGWEGRAGSQVHQQSGIIRKNYNDTRVDGLCDLKLDDYKVFCCCTDEFTAQF